MSSVGRHDPVTRTSVTVALGPQDGSFRGVSQAQLLVGQVCTYENIEVTHSGVGNLLDSTLGGARGGE